jgi:CRAL/TRIO domain
MIVICNCPSWFHQLWKIIRAFIAPATLEKIKILKSGAIFDELSKHIDETNIPPG